jgi:mutator protein MutT
MSQIEAVSAVLYDEEGKVFMAKRPKGKVLADKWEFPGGKIEPNESLEDCLHREIAEELDIKIIPRQYIGKQSYMYDHGLVTLHLFACKLDLNQKPKLIEHQEARWVHLSQVLKLDVPEIVHPFMDDIQATLLRLGLPIH